jgi:uncharacterized protein
MKTDRLSANNYNVRKIRDRYLITLGHGNWIAMTENDFRQLQRNKVPEKIANECENIGLLLTAKGARNTIESYSKRTRFLHYPPSLHIIVPTLRCNLTCDYCHSKAKQETSREVDMNKEIAEETVNFIMDTKSKNITIEFQGGEPLLNFEIVKHVVEYSQKKNESRKKEKQKHIGYVIVSNLSLVTEEIIKFIKIHKIQVCTSIDGPKALHDKHRKCKEKGSYDHTIRCVDKLKDNNIQVSMLMTTTRDSLDYSKEIIDEYLKHEQNIIQLKPINWIGYAENSKRYTPEEFIIFWKKALDYLIELNNKGTNIKERITTILLQKILTNTDPNFLDIRSPCGAIIGQVLYNYDGNIYCCDDGKIFDIFKVGNVFKENYTNILNKPETKALISSSINSQYLCSACAYQPYCGTCPVANYAEEGTVVPKLYKNFRCKIRKAQFDYLFEMILFEPEKAKIIKKWIKD